MLTASRLTPLRKLLGGLRPICCGLLFYRIGMRYALKALQKREQLLSYQFGVGSKGGVEPILEFIQQSVDSCTEERKLWLIEADQKVAFNFFDREAMADAIHEHAKPFYRLATFAYGKASPLVLATPSGIKVISNSQGSRQGGPEGSFFYSIGMRPVLTSLKAEVLSVTDRLLSYLDNLYIVTDNPDLWPGVQAFFARNKEKYGCELKPSGCAVHDLYAVKKGEQAISTLGACIGSANLRSEFLQQKIDIQQQKIERLKQLPHQHSLLMLRMSFAQQLRHLLRSMDTTGVIDKVSKIDSVIFSHVDFVGDLTHQGERPAMQTSIIALPQRLGGMGLMSHADTVECARQVSLCNSRNELVDRELTTREAMAALADQLEAEDVETNPYSAVSAMPSAADEAQLQPTQRQLTQAIMEDEQKRLLETMTPEQQEIFVDNMASIGWMRALPQGQFRRLSDKQMTALICIHLMKPTSTGPLCPHCSRHNQVNEYELCTACPQIARQTCYRHNYIRDKLVSVANHDGNFTASSEPKVFAEQPTNNNNQRADILIRARADQQEQQALNGMYDVMTKVVNSQHTVTARNSAEVKARQGSITDIIRICRLRIQAALEVGLKQKKANYVEATAAGIKVTPLLVSTGGTMHKDMHKFIKRLLPDSIVRRKVLTDIAVALARGRANLYRHVFPAGDAAAGVTI